MRYQVFVHGDSLKSCVIAIIVPEQKEIQDWAFHSGISNESFIDLCASREVKKLLMQEILQLSKQAELAYYEEVKVTIDMLHSLWQVAWASGFITHVVLFAGYLPPSTDVLSAERIAQQRRQPAETEISQVFQTTAGRHVQVSQLISMLAIHCTNLKI